MSAVYDNWERLVGAVLKREQFRRLALCDSFSSSSSSSSQPSPKSSHGELEHGPLDETIASQIFTFRALATATRNFHVNCLLDEGGFGKRFKGQLEFNGSSHVVAIKQYDLNGLQGNREFLTEVLMLSLLRHPNVARLIGYCAEGDNRLVVNEYMPMGSLYDHLHNQELGQGREHLDWNSRMKIAVGVAKGLEYLHHKANPPVIHCNVKSSSIMLGEGYDPKIVNFGLAKLGPVGDNTHVSTRVMGTAGYCAPEYAMTGKLSLKADVYSFGVLLLEIISGRKAIMGDNLNLVEWARPLINDMRNRTKLVDPALCGHYPVRALYQATAVAAMCVANEAETRPTMDDITTALVYVSSQEYVRNSTGN